MSRRASARIVISWDNVTPQARPLGRRLQEIVRFVSSSECFYFSKIGTASSALLIKEPSLQFGLADW